MPSSTPTQTKARKEPIFNSDKELADFLLQNLTDSLKQSIRATVRLMIKTDMEHFREEVNQKLSFNGHYDRHMISPLGKIEGIQIPRWRESSVSAQNLRSFSVFDQEKERFYELIAQMHRLGVSQRKIKLLCDTVFGVKLGAARAGIIHKELAQSEALNINGQPLTDEFEYLLIDGLWVKAKSFGLKNTNKTVLLCALGITAEGKRKVIGFLPADNESFESWSAILENLKSRGLSGEALKLIIADDNAGLTKAAGHYYPNAKIQVCIVHKMRNVIIAAKPKNRKLVALDLKPVYQAESKAQALERMKAFAKKWYVAEEVSVRSLTFDFERTLTYLEFPRELWSRIRTNNLLEREFREVRRRIKVFDSSFDSAESLKRYSNSIFDYLNHHYPANGYTH
jgi:transposase-like protein